MRTIPLALAGVLLSATMCGPRVEPRVDSSPSTTTPPPAASTSSELEPEPDPPKPTPVVEYDGPCPVGMKLADGGSFTPAQRESLTERYGAPPDLVFDVAPFCLAVLETTQAEFHECIVAGACVKDRDFDPGGGRSPRPCMSAAAGCPNDDANLPAWFITIKGAQAYCEFRGGRVPTLVEWYWAASGGDEARHYPWGNSTPTNRRLNVSDEQFLRAQCCEDEFEKVPLKSCAEPSCLREYQPLLRTNDGYSFHAPVGSYPAGAGRWGQLDLLGNVDELVAWWEGEIACGGNASSKADTALDLHKHICLSSPSLAMRGVRCAADPKP